MSTLDFNKRASISITINISGSGQFDPTGSSTNKMNWSLTGAITANNEESNLTTKEWLCGVPYGSVNKIYTSFGAVSSNGNTSGTIDTGVLPYRPIPENVIGRELGTWTVNSNPVLSNFGKVNGQTSLRGHYVVNKPADATVDDPIILDPPIDNVARVYPGDYVFLMGDGENARWYVGPQRRQPRTDRTFFWEPNVNPYLQSGGLANGVLAKPGTIMIPTANLYVENQQDRVDGIKYIYSNYGLIFNGQVWTRIISDPFVYQPSPQDPSEQPPPPEFRNFEVFFSTGDQLYATLLEYDQANKPFVITSKTIDDNSPAVLTYTPDEGEPYSVDLYFRWFGAMGNENGIMPRPVLYDFNDAWTRYHQANSDWAVARKLFTFTGAGFSLKSNTGVEPETEIFLQCERFADGDVTTITETISVDGEELTNSFSVSLDINVSMA
jgi:hypothetical protein